VHCGTEEIRADVAATETDQGDVERSLLDAIASTPRSQEGLRVTGERVTPRVQPFGTLPDGRPVSSFSLSNAHGLEVEVIDYGAAVRALRAPDATGETENVVLGFSSLSGYLGTAYFGATIGGASGFDKKLWSSERDDAPGSEGVRLSYTSPDGEEGFPGTLTATVTYRVLGETNALRVEYEAVTDAPTLVNLTNHSYFNLAGEGSGSIEDHRIRLNADRYLPLTADRVPTGAARPVTGTPMDLRTMQPVAAGIRSGFDQLVLGNGYDHNFVLDQGSGMSGLTFAARVEEPRSGRCMELWTTAPVVVFYTGNSFDGSIVGTSGRAYRQRDALALEPQTYSDGPNHGRFATAVLRPGETYRAATEYRFDAASESA
jgi:aldose 1-epimerase